MKGNKYFLILALLILAPLFTMNCSGDDTAIVRIQLVNVPEGAVQSSNSVFERVFRWFVPSAWATIPQSWVLPWNSIQIVISAQDLEDITFTMPPTERVLSLELPAGPARRITAYGIGTSYGKNWGGHVEINLNPGDDIDAQINMLPMTTLVMDGSVNLQWGTVGTTYGVTGYNIYRAENINGPYKKIKTVVGVSTSGTSDNDTLISGVTYYYKINVNTADSEGELSDSKSYVYP